MRTKSMIVGAIVWLVLAGLVMLSGCGRTTASKTSTTSSASPGASASASSTQQTGTARPLGSSSTTQAQAPVAPEKNPPGDIPDTQAFVVYKSAEGKFQIKVPEGWSQAKGSSRVEFSDKLNGVAVNWAPSGSAPSVSQAKSTEVPELSRTEAAFKLVSVEQVTLPGGPAVLIRYQKNSEPNSVTGKQYRLDVLRYEFFKNGEQANLILLSPVGADNVDPWRIVSESFKWQS